MTVTVEWPMALPSAGNLHEHWRHRQRRVKAQRAATLLVLKANRWSKGLYDFNACAVTGNTITRLAVRLTRISPRMLDDDNLQFAFKGIRDQVAAYFGIDDADPRIRFEYAQQAGKPSRVRIDFDVDDLRDLRDLRATAERNAAATERRIAEDVARLEAGR